MPGSKLLKEMSFHLMEKKKKQKNCNSLVGGVTEQFLTVKAAGTQVVILNKYNKLGSCSCH